MNKVILPTPEDLAPFYAEATAKQTEQEWKDKVLLNAAIILRTDPLTYRSYGPFWWGFKKLIIEGGLLPESDFLDAEWLDKVKYKKDSDMILAAVTYHIDKQSYGNYAYEQQHFIEVEDEDGDIVSREYNLFDEDLELMHVAIALTKR